MRLVLFDLDGTITYRDTLFPYVTGFLAHARPQPPAHGAAACRPWPRSRWALPITARSSQAFIRATLGGATRPQLRAWTR